MSNRLTILLFATILWLPLKQYLELPFFLVSCIPNNEVPHAQGLLPIPDKLVVLTFDDGCKSDVEFVMPLLKKYGFGATFFYTPAFAQDNRLKDGNYMTWEDVLKIHNSGFEIGNHTRNHPSVVGLSELKLKAELEYIENRCKEYGIAAPVSFCYPGFLFDQNAVQVLREKGYLFARRGVSPEFQDNDKGARGPVYDPTEDDPLLIPCTGYSGPDWGFEDFLWALKQGGKGKIPVLAFHGIPDLDHPWVNTDTTVFRKYMDYLRDNDYTVIAMRDLVKYVDPSKYPADPFAPINRRISRLRIIVSQLRCEYTNNPLGLDTEQPRFSWTLISSRRGQIQAAYQILVASSLEKLTKERGDKWDSGKLDSDQSVNVVYQGKELASGERCWWKVRVWDKNGKVSAFSEPATFEMGLLKQSDWQGQWIEAAQHISAPLFRREFAISGDIKRARAYISGLGWNEFYINGEKVSDHVLDPATTYYNNDQPFELGSRVLYATHDVTEYLHNGQNAMGVMLGNGWYSNDAGILGKNKMKTQPFGDRPILLLKMNIEYTDGRVESFVTDNKWKVSDGPVTANEICLGEDYDARLEKTGWDSPGYNDSKWDNAVIADPPSGKMVSQIMPAVKVMKTMKPVKITQPAEGVYIYDFGQHFSGWTRLRVEGPRGTKVTIRHAGMLYDDGRIDTRNQLEAAQTDTYILKGEGTEEWEPRFTLHGFRYAEVTGFPGTPTLINLEGRFAYNAVETSGSFNCSNALLNQIHSNVCWTFMSSLKGIPQDAAERNERVAWLGDPGFVFEDYLYNFNTVLFWTKWLDDIKDSQKTDGDVPVVSPLHWRNSYDMMPCWKSTYPLVVWYLYRYYGDERVLATHYEGIAKLVEFLGTKADNYVIAEGLGDHMEPDRTAGYSNFRPQRTPPAITSTGFYYFDTWILAQAAKVLEKTEDYKRYSSLADNIKNAFNEKFLNKETNQYATGSQTSNAMSLQLGLVPKERQEAVLKNLVDDILVKNEGHLSTGILGTNALEQVLGKSGRADVMFEIATKTTYPSWGYTISKGATTVWESFENDSQKPYIISLNMKMFGSTEKFFYKDLAGIGLGDIGFKQITIRPCIVGDLTYVNASLKTVRGLIAVDWKRADQSVEMKVTLPPNSMGKVSVPKIQLKNVTITESGNTVWKDGLYVGKVLGITGGSETEDYVTFDVGSGNYLFQLSGQTQ